MRRLTMWKKTHWPVIILTRKEEAAYWTPIGTLCEAMGSHRAVSLFSSTAWFDCVSRSGVRIPVKIIFSLFSFSQLSATVNQWRIFFESLYRLIDWLISMSCHWSHSTKNCLDWDSNPRPGNVECEVELAQYGELQHTLDTQSSHAVEEDRESALWLPIAWHSVPMGVH